MSRNHGRHELGQNFLVDPAVVDSVLAVVATWPNRPLIELGPGDGVLTCALAALGHPLTVVELDPRRAERLRHRFAGRAEIVHGDLLDADFASGAHIVSNVPFGITTPLLRRLLQADCWQHALLLLQWEVARKRAAVGGTTMMTAQCWPWFELDLVDRVPASAFRPQPSVDGGLLHLRRRPVPLVPSTDRPAYEQLVGDIFAGRGRGAEEIVRRKCGGRVARAWADRFDVPPRALPRDLDANTWAGLFRLARR